MKTIAEKDMRTIAIDFDGVIHKYSKGWQDGSIYDEPFEDAFESIRELMEDGYSVFVFTARNVKQTKEWLRSKTYTKELVGDAIPSIVELDNYKYDFSVKKIPFWIKFWQKRFVLGVTNRKLPAQIYIDDRAYKFKGDWKETTREIKKLTK